MDKEFIPYVYYLEDTIRQVKYIGSEYAIKTKIANPGNLWTDYFTSSKLLHEHISKYGKDSIDKIEILYTSTIGTVDERISDVLLMESHYLNKFDAKLNKEFLNMHNGDGKFFLRSHTAEACNKISKSRKGITFTIDHCANISKSSKGRVGPNLGKTFTDIHRQHLKENHIGTTGKIWSDETKEKMSLTKKGKICTAEHKENIRLSKLGPKNHNYGIPKSNTTKKLSSIKNRRMAYLRKEFSNEHSIPYKLVTLINKDFQLYVNTTYDTLVWIN